MVYKDPDKQREANKLRQRRYRRGLGRQSVTKGVTDTGCDKQGVTDQEFTRLMATAKPGHIRVSKPGDADYEPQCETTKAFIKDKPKVKPESKRGLDIKVFEDLPPDVQETIRNVSDSNEEFKKRTAAAIKYQHLFPGRY